MKSAKSRRVDRVETLDPNIVPLTHFRKMEEDPIPQRMDRQSGYLPIASCASSLERLVAHKDEIQKHVSGPFRVQQVGHWCENSKQDPSIFVGWQGSKRRRMSLEEFLTNTEKFRRYCFIFDLVEGNASKVCIGTKEQPPLSCLAFSQEPKWSELVMQYAPNDSPLPFCKISASAKLGQPWIPQAFHIVPVWGYAISRRATEEPQVWSVHIAMPAEDLPPKFAVKSDLLMASQFFERGIRQWDPMSDLVWLPKPMDGTCTLSAEASQLLDGTLVHRPVKEDSKTIEVEAISSALKSNYKMDSNPIFECKFPDGITLVVDGNWFRDIQC